MRTSELRLEDACGGVDIVGPAASADVDGLAESACPRLVEAICLEACPGSGVDGGRCSRHVRHSGLAMRNEKSEDGGITGPVDAEGGTEMGERDCDDDGEEAAEDPDSERGRGTDAATKRRRGDAPQPDESLPCGIGSREPYHGVADLPVQAIQLGLRKQWRHCPPL